MKQRSNRRVAWSAVSGAVLVSGVALGASVGCSADDAADASDVASSDAELAAGEESIFGGAVPVNPSEADGAAVELGMKFRTARSGVVTGVRFYKGAGNGGTHTGHLWDAAGNALGSVTFKRERSSGWQLARFATPVRVTPGATYVVSYYAPQGHYAGDNHGMDAAHVSASGALTGLANGTDGSNDVYTYGATAFPTSTYAASNYFVDVAFRADTADGGTTIDSGVATSDSGGSDAAPPPPPPPPPSGAFLGGFFPIGVWVQPSSMFSTWKSRGVTMLNGVPDGNDPAAWTTAAKAAGFKYMREPLASASSDVGDTSLLAWSQPDEPDGIYSQVPYTTIQATYANWKSIDPSRAVSINFVGALNQYDLKTGESGTAWYQKYCAGADWLSADTYPLNNGGSISDVGVMLDKLRSFDATKPRFAFIESGDYDTTNGTTPPTADQFRGEVWEAVVHGARGISYFSVRVSGGFLWDMTPAEVAQEMTKQDATLTALGPVLQGAINPAGVSASAASPLEVAWRVDSSGGKYVIVLNQSATARTGTVTVSGSSATSASVYGESRTVPVTSGAITDSFGAYAVHIYQMP